MSSPASENPLAYWCSPCGCTPEYRPASTMHDFLGYGLLRCWIDPRDTTCPITPDDVADLRTAFLNCVEDAIRFWREQEVGVDTGCDPAEPTVILDLPGSDVCVVLWKFERVDEDALLFVMFWTGSDDLAIWLAKGAIAGKEPEALAAVEAARRVLGLRPAGVRP